MTWCGFLTTFQNLEKPSDSIQRKNPDRRMKWWKNRWTQLILWNPFGYHRGRVKLKWSIWFLLKIPPTKECCHSITKDKYWKLRPRQVFLQYFKCLTFYFMLQQLHWKESFSKFRHALTCHYPFTVHSIGLDPVSSFFECLWAFKINI